MIKRIEKSISIERSPEEIFSYVSVVENMPNWTSISSVEKVSGGGEVGTIYAIVTPTLFAKRRARIEVTQKLPPSLFAYRDPSLSFSNEVGYEIHEINGSITVTMYKQIDLGPIASLINGNLLGKSVQAEMEKMLLKLKDFMENQFPGITPVQPLPGENSEIDISSESSDIEALLGKTPEEIAIKFKKSNY